MAVDFPYQDDPYKYYRAVGQGLSYAYRNREWIRETTKGVARGIGEFRESLKKKNMFKRRMGRAHPAGPAGDYRDQDVGQAVGRLWECTTGTMKPKKVRYSKAVKELLDRNCFIFQSLFYSPLTPTFRNEGCFQLRSYYTIGSSTVFPQTIHYPVYVYRLSCPNGTQYENTTTPVDFNIPASPTICYQLVSLQLAADQRAEYRWQLVNNAMIQNNIPDVTMRAAITDRSFNTAAGVDLADDHNFGNTQKICHESSDIQVLFTAPTNNPIDVSVSIVSFDEESAPPDQYYDWSSSIGEPPLNTIDYGMSTEEKAVKFTFSDRVANWLSAKMSHPCFQQVYSRGMTRTQFWVEHNKFCKTLSSRDTTNSDVNPVQYKHRHLYRPNTWHNTVMVPEDNPKLKATNLVDINCATTGGDQHPPASGLFPRSDLQKWLMVTGFTRGSVGAVDSLPNKNTDGFFDVSIRSWFSSACRPAGSRF